MSGNAAEQAELARCQARVAALESELAQVRSAQSTTGKQSHLETLQQECDRLRQSELRYRQIFENAPISMLLINTDGYCTQMNAAAEDLFGLTIDQLNQQACPIFDNSQLVENGTLPYMRQAFAGESVVEPPNFYDARDEGGKLNQGRGHYAPICNAAGAVEEIVEIGANYNEFFAVQAQLLQEKDRAAQERAQLLGTIAQVANLLLRGSIEPASRLPDYTTVLPDVVRLLGEAVGSDRCCLTQEIVDLATQKVAIKFVAEHTSIAKNSDFVEPEYRTVEIIAEELAFELRRRILQGESVNFLVAQLPDSAWKSFFEAQQCTSLLIVPIMVKGWCWGEISFSNCGQPRLFDEMEVAILKIVADSLAAAIERQAKDDELRQSEALYRSLFEISNAGIYRFELDPPISTSLPAEEQLNLAYSRYKLAEANQTFVAMYGLTSPDGLLGRELVNIYPKHSEENLEFNYDFINNGY